MAAAQPCVVAKGGDCAAMAADGHPLLYSGGTITLRVCQLHAVRVRAAPVHSVAGQELDPAPPVSSGRMEGTAVSHRSVVLCNKNRLHASIEIASFCSYGSAHTKG